MAEEFPSKIFSNDLNYQGETVMVVDAAKLSNTNPTVTSQFS